MNLFSLILMLGWVPPARAAGVICVLPDRLLDEEQHQDHTGADSAPNRPGAFTRGDLPHPAPVQREVQEDRCNKEVADPGVDPAPFMAIPSECREPMSALGSRQQPEGQQQPGATHGAKTEPEQEVEHAGQDRLAGRTFGLVCVRVHVGILVFREITK